MPTIRTLFCLVDNKKRSLWTSCVFWFVFLNASNHLCFRCFVSNLVGWMDLTSKLFFSGWSVGVTVGLVRYIRIKLFPWSSSFQHNLARVGLTRFQKNNLISKLDLCEGGSFSPMIFKSDIELSVYHISCFISVCPFVALLKATCAEHLHIVLSSPY